MSPPSARRAGWLPYPLLTVLLATVFLMLYESLAPAVVLWAVLLAVLIPRLVHPFLGPVTRVHAWGAAARLTGVVLWDIVMSNVIVARIVLNPASRPRPAWVPVPLDLRNEAAVNLMATIITTTPGTVSCVVDDQRWVILVHALDCDDVAESARQMKERYEVPLRRIFEGMP
jgi:multicomponent K+:H+ antiporter subunit E